VSDLPGMDLKQPREVALKFLARREHSQKELQQKLYKKGFVQAQIIPVLEFLSTKGWQSDERFAECYIRSRISAGFGSVRITFELSQRGVQDHLIVKHLRQKDDQFWVNQLRRVFFKQFKQVADEQHRYAKQYRFLQSRGFAQHRIIQFLKGYDNEYQ